MKKKTAKIGLWITGDGRMTEKYTVKKWYDENAIYYKGEIFAIVDVRNQANKICDRLNELSTENEHLKSDIIAIEKRADKVWEENEQLKKEYNKLKHRHSLLHDVCIEAECDRDRYHNDVLSLEKGNEQLKQTIREVTELLTDEVDVFSDKAVEHDINAYIELKELDNKDAFYMAKATKTAIKMLKGDVE